MTNLARGTWFVDPRFMSLDLKAVFDYADCAILWRCLSLKMCRRNSFHLSRFYMWTANSRVCAHGDLSPKFVRISLSIFHWSCPHMRIVAVMFAQTEICLTCNMWTILYCWVRTQSSWVFVSYLNDTVTMLGMCLTPSKCKLLLDGFIGSKPNLVLARNGAVT